MLETTSNNRNKTRSFPAKTLSRTFQRTSRALQLVRVRVFTKAFRAVRVCKSMYDNWLCDIKFTSMISWERQFHRSLHKISFPDIFLTAFTLNVDLFCNQRIHLTRVEKYHLVHLVPEWKKLQKTQIKQLTVQFPWKWTGQECTW